MNTRFRHEAALIGEGCHRRPVRNVLDGSTRGNARCQAANNESRVGVAGIRGQDEAGYQEGVDLTFVTVDMCNAGVIRVWDAAAVATDES